VADRPNDQRAAGRDGSDDAHRVVRRPRRGSSRWSRWPTSRRVLAATGAVALAAVAVLAAGSAWGLWSFSRIERVDLSLAAREPTEPQNFLVVGSDSREAIDEDHPGADGMLGSDAPPGQRSDSLMVARVDPGGDRIDLLSIPRDLWVPIAGTGEEQRINTAYSHSAQTVVDTVQQALGIPIHHFVEVDFSGFSRLVDALGGVPMYFDAAVRDTSSGLYVDAPGCRVLDGHAGLAFARARHLEWNDGVRWHADPTGDLGRMTRQQLLTRAALAKAQTLGLGDVGRLKGLVDAAVGAVRLDATLGAKDLMDLGSRMSDLDPDRMQTHGLPVLAHRTGGGAAVVLLDEPAAEPVLALFRGTAAPSPVTTTTAPPPSPAQVTVEVRNGTGEEGEARRVSFVLSTGGFVPGAVLPSDPVGRTLIEYPPRSRAMAELVAAWLSPRAELSEDDGLGEATVRVTLGTDFERVAEPDDAASPGPVAPDDAAPGVTAAQGDVAAGGAASTTTTTQPGWTPGQAPEGVSCP
jgi:LCP family protein required for cell wall assembly